MNEKKNPKQTLKFHARKKNRGAAVAAVLCFVTAIAVVGTYTYQDYQDSVEELSKENDANTQTAQTEESEAANADDVQSALTEDLETDPLLSEGTDETEENNESAQEDAAAGTQEDSDGESASRTAGDGTSVSFSGQDKLLWPVEGKLLMSFSMDKTVYFSTLDQFKYNPALIIQGEKGDQVIASAPGVVKSIDNSAETGTTVNVDIGSGYELFYGQLDDVAVQTGDYVESKTLLGYVGEPTIYYSEEGANVYFEMRKDGQPVDPMEYLVE